MSFESLSLPQELTRAVADAGYDTPTEVQSQAIPPALAGKDLMVASSTGSGKTASFMLPALARILAARQDPAQRRDTRDRRKVWGPRVLVLTPTRELALQVAKAASEYGRHVPGLRVATVVGGVPYPAQIRALQGPLDILISTPGRLLDHLSTGKAVIENVEMFVLDEADRMLDMGFIDDIQFIAEQVPAARQTVMYSATFLGHVGRLAAQLMKEPQRVEVASHTDSHANIQQRLHWADDPTHKNALLDHILTERELEQAVVFTSTQRDADWLADRLADMGHSVAALHGGMPQGRRNRVLQGLRQKQLRVLVATDVAARGIDVPTISHVINYGLPMKAEDYVHRIGRTGRAGRNGLAITLAERMDVGMIRRIQHFTTQDIPVERILGLEPRMQEPQVFRPRPQFGAGGPGFGRPARPGWRGADGGPRGRGPAGGPPAFDRGPVGGRPPFDGRRGGGPGFHAAGGPQGRPSRPADGAMPHRAHDAFNRPADRGFDRPSDRSFDRPVDRAFNRPADGPDRGFAPRRGAPPKRAR
jgi:superfamily II DNA/RNA helicase